MSFSRPYDIAIHRDVLRKVKERRESPTGEIHEVTTETRGDTVVQVYPWKKMELGDFFIAEIGQRSPKAMRNGFLAASRRYDYELAVKVVKNLLGEKAFQVTLTIIGVKHLRKAAAIHHGVPIKVKDDNWAKAKRRVSFDRPRSKRPSRNLSSKPHLEPEVERGMTREEIVAFALRNEK